MKKDKTSGTKRAMQELLGAALTDVDRDYPVCARCKQAEIDPDEYPPLCDGCLDILKWEANQD